MRSRGIRVWLVGAALLIVVLGALAASLALWFHTWSPNRAEYPVRGIDVSHHQGVIDWPRVAQDDVSFAIIKATEGGDHVDRLFADNVKAARAAGLPIGAYHFFTFCRPGADQAKNFISTVPEKEMMLPPVVDIEFGGNCPKRPTVSELQAELTAFLTPVEETFGAKAVIYIIGDAVRDYAAAIPERPRWVRSLAARPDDSDWVYWQFHNRGGVDGISGPVDLNVFNGTQADFASFLKSLESNVSPASNAAFQGSL